MKKLDISVLLVEDDNLSLKLYSNFLESTVREVYTARDGIEGLEMFAKCNPDIIISDIIMPKLDGLEMSRKIRESNERVKIILISGYQETDYFIKSIELGISGYLLKPIDKKKLISIINDIVSNILLDKKVKETEKRFKDLAELLPEIVFEADLSGQFTFINKKANQILGFSDDEIEKGLFIHKVILPELESIENMNTILEQTEEESLGKEIEIRIRTKGGKTFPALMYTSPIVDSSGSTIGIRGVIVNITKQKQVENELQLLNVDLESKVEERTQLLNQRIQFIEIINKTSSDLIRLDTTKIDQSINTALHDVCIFTKADRGYVYLLNDTKDAFEIFSEYCKKGIPSRTHSVPRLDNLATNPNENILKNAESLIYYKNGDTLIFNKEGERRLINQVRIKKVLNNKDTSQKLNNLEFDSCLIYSMYRGNSPIGFYGFDTLDKDYNWTKEKIYAYKITGQIITNTIQRRQDDDELIKAKEKAEESDKSKSTFLANISHEIQTPIKAIISFSNMIQSQKISVGRKDELLNIVNINSQLLLNLTNDILELTKIQSNVIKLYKIKFDINLFLEEMYTLFNSIKLRKGKEDIELKTRIPSIANKLIIHSDPSRLKQIFSNLIGNSFKFSQQGFVEYGYEITKKNSLKFFVKDTGIGISMKYQKLIFDRFIQEPKPLSIKKEGTGLGLAITHSLVKLMDGKIWVESELGSGSTFYFEIPDIISQDVENLKQLSSEGRKILIVDDDIQDYIKFEKILDENVKTLYVSDSKQAIEICKNNKEIIAAFVSCSIIFKENNDFDNLKEIIPEIKIIGLVDQDTSVKEFKKKCKHTDEIITKPIDANILINTLQKHLGNND